jgi:hypothetical protein
MKIPMKKQKKNEKQGNMTPPKVSNSTIVGCNDKEVDEIPDKILKE